MSLVEVDALVHIDTVVASYPGTTVLDGLSLTVASGQFVSIIGPSGCGKSTVFGLLAGLHTPDSGTIRAPRCGYMPQKDLLLPWRTILDNTILGLEVQGVPRRVARKRARELLPVFGLEAFADARPSALSGGMRQRAALLRTVLTDRRVLLLDEPLGALDSLTRTAMQDWLQTMWSQYRWTMLMITHDVREAVYLSDRVLVMAPRPSRVVADIAIDLPRPRTVETALSPTFAEYERRLIAALSGALLE